MPMLIPALTLYAVCGALIAAGFLLFGLDRIDPAARDAYWFRALLLPGLILLWPMVVWRWIAGPAV